MKPRFLGMVAMLLGCCADAFAGGPCSGVRGGCGRSSYRSSSSGSSSGVSDSTSTGGSVYVSGYYRADGTYVRPHFRSAPGSSGSYGPGFSGGNASNYEPPVEEPIQPVTVAPRMTFRTAPRTAFRSTYWSGTGSAYDAPIAAESLDDSTAAPETPVEPPPKYTVFLTTGKTRDILDYRDDGGSYYVSTSGGGHIRYPKKIVSKIEPIAEAAAVTVK